MGRILDKNLYPIDTVVSKDDYVLGTDIDQNLRTVNFNIGSIIRLINSEINFVSTEYKFSDGTDPELSAEDQGVFTSNANNTDPALVQKLLFNKLNIGGQDLTDLFTLMINNVYTFSLKVVNASDPADVFYFRILSVTDATTHYEVNVEVIGQNYARPLKDLTTYNLFMEVIGSQNNKNLVKSVSVTGSITAAKTATAINALPQFVVSDEQNVYYHVTSDNGDEVTYITVGKGKDTYGTGGTQLVAADLQYISSTTGGSFSVVKKDVTYNGAYSVDKVVAGFNALPVFAVGGNTLVYVFAQSAGSPETHVFVAKGLGAGDYGIGANQITAENIDLISIIGGGNSNIVKEVTITGEVTETNVATAINALPLFTVGPNQNVYYKATISGTSTVYTFVTQGKGSGNYGNGGIQLVAADLSLISVNSGGTAWNLKVGGTQKLAVKEGASVDFKGMKYAVVTYKDGGIVEISTSQALDDLLSTFRPIIRKTYAEHQAMITDGTIDPDTIYVIPCSTI